MTAEQIISLPHPEALKALHHADLDTVIRLAYREYADQPIECSDALASAAYDEMERRQTAETALERWTARQHNQPKILAPTLTLKRGQRVAHQRLVGPFFEPDWSETATICGKPHSVSQTSGFWWPVKFADGGALYVHESQLRPL